MCKMFEKASFRNADLVKELRCKAGTKSFFTSALEKEMCETNHLLHGDKACELCEYHNSESPIISKYDIYDLGNSAASVIELLMKRCGKYRAELEECRAELEACRAELEAAKKDIRKLLLVGIELKDNKKSQAPICAYCGETDFSKCAASCKAHTRWRGIAEPEDE